MITRGRTVSDQVVALLLLAAAIAIRAILWNRIDDHPWWLAPLLDARLYHRLGESLAAHGIAGLGELPVGPLYPLFIGGLYTLLPADPWTLRIVQGLLGAALPPLLFLVGSRVGGRTAGVASGGAALLCGPLVAHETDLTPASLSVLAVTLLIVLCLPGASGRSAAFARGAVFALAASLRPNLLLLAPLPFVLTWRRGRWGAIPLLLAGFALVALPQTWLIHRGGGSGLVAPHGGVNLFIGNHVGATGIWRSPWPWSGDVADFNLSAPREEAERRVGRPLTSPQVSRYWTTQALRFWRDHPGAAIAVTARKVFLLLNDIEVPLNLPYPVVRRELPALALLPVTWGILLPFAFLGFALRPKGDGASPVLALTLAGGAATILPFFVADRYRLCLYPAAILLAGLGVSRLLAARGRRALLGPSVAAAFLAVAAFLPSGVSLAGEELTYRFNCGVNLLRGDRLAEADAVFAPLGAGPLATRALTNRGAIALRRGNRDAAAGFLRAALARSPGDPAATALLAEAEASAAMGGTRRWSE